MDRDSSFRINFTAGEREMLRDLAAAQGVTSADVLRLYIRREHAATMGENELATTKGCAEDLEARSERTRALTKWKAIRYPEVPASAVAVLAPEVRAFKVVRRCPRDRPRGAMPSCRAPSW